MGASRIFSSSSLVEPATIELEPAREPPLILQATTAICKFLFEAIVILKDRLWPRLSDVSLNCKAFFQ